MLAKKEEKNCKTILIILLLIEICLFKKSENSSEVIDGYLKSLTHEL